MDGWMDGWMDPLVGNGIGEEGVKVAFREKKKHLSLLPPLQESKQNEVLSGAKGPVYPTISVNPVVQKSGQQM
jgi:hypothetical protein